MAQDFQKELQRLQGERQAAAAEAVRAAQKAEWYRGLCEYAMNEPAGSPFELLFGPSDVGMLHAFIDEADRLNYRNSLALRLDDKRQPQPLSGKRRPLWEGRGYEVGEISWSDPSMEFAVYAAAGYSGVKPRIKVVACTDHRLRVHIFGGSLLFGYVPEGGTLRLGDWVTNGASDTSYFMPKQLATVLAERLG